LPGPPHTHCRTRHA